MASPVLNQTKGLASHTPGGYIEVMASKTNALNKRAGENDAWASHRELSSRINRVKGQLDGVLKMIEERRYCPDILAQIKAARASLLSFETLILERHLKECVRGALASTDREKQEKLLDDIAEVFRRSTP